MRTHTHTQHTRTRALKLYAQATTAQRWCVACDDPFCLECWSRAHARGRRAAHAFCAIAPNGEVCAHAAVATAAAAAADAGAMTRRACVCGSRC
jgi:hypothetical protein